MDNLYREYAPELVEKLNRPGEIIEVNGLPVEVKDVPDGDGIHRLDPRTRAFAETMAKQQEAWSEGEDSGAPPIEVMREHMGGFNYNLNTVEIYTRYIEVPTSHGAVPVWIHYPRNSKGKKPGFLYVHGGAFLGGTPFVLENQCRLIAERGDCITFNVDYDLAPEHPYPIPCEEVYEVLCYIHDHADGITGKRSKAELDPNRLMMAGDSAGGNLTAVCAQMDRDKGTNYLKQIALFYAKLTFTNHELPGYARDKSAFFVAEDEEPYLKGLLGIGSDETNAGDERVYVQGQHDIKEPYISPTFGKKEGLCPALILLAEMDGLRLEGEFYGKQLKDAGVSVRVIRYNGIGHGFFDRLGILPQAEAALNEIVQVIRTL